MMADLSPKKQRALAALLTYPTQAEAAAACGMSARGLRKWLSEDARFKQAYHEACDTLLTEASTQARLTVNPALKTLQEVMENPETPAAARISAAKTLLEFSIRIQETLDFAERISELEGKSTWE